MAKQTEKDRRRAHFESDLLRHSLCLVGQHHGVAVTPSFLARVLPQLKLLHGREREAVPHSSVKGTSSWKWTCLSLTVASLLSISGPAFSTAVFWIKQQASSQLSCEILAAASSIISLC